MTFVPTYCINQTMDCHIPFSAVQNLDQLIYICKQLPLVEILVTRTVINCVIRHQTNCCEFPLWSNEFEIGSFGLCGL